MGSKIFGKYTPMDVKTLIKLMNKYPDVRIITDTKYTDTGTIKKQFRTIVNTARDLGMSRVLDRFVVEIYSESMLKTVKGIYPFKAYLYTLYKKFKSAPSKSALRSVAQFCSRNGVRTIGMFTFWWKPEYEDVVAPYDIDIALYTTNSKKQRNRFFDQGVTALFTDFLPPV